MQIMFHPLSFIIHPSTPSTRVGTKIPRFWTLHWSLSPMVPSYLVLLFWPYQTWVRYLFDREISHRWYPKLAPTSSEWKQSEVFEGLVTFWGCFFDSQTKFQTAKLQWESKSRKLILKKGGRVMHLFLLSFFWCSLMKCQLTQFQDPLKKRGCDVRQLNQYIFCFFFGSLGMGETCILGLDHTVWFPLPQLGLRKLWQIAGDVLRTAASWRF